MEVLASDAAKQAWLLAHLPQLVDNGQVVVFANHKSKVDELGAAAQAAGIRRAPWTARPHPVLGGGSRRPSGPPRHAVAGV